MGEIASSCTAERAPPFLRFRSWNRQHSVALVAVVVGALQTAVDAGEAKSWRRHESIVPALSLVQVQSKKLVESRSNATPQFANLIRTHQSMRQSFSLEALSLRTTNCQAPPKEMHHVTSGQIVDDWRAVPLPSQLATQVFGPKLMIMMMIYRQIAFPRTWRAFLENAPTGSVSMLIHAMDNVSVPEFFQPYYLRQKFPAKRCNAVTLMIEMMSVALRDPFATHFAVVSGDTLPLRTMSVLRSEINSDSRSRFCMDHEWGRAETWMVLNRRHASLICSHRERFFKFMEAQKMLCPDEEVFYLALSVRDANLADQCHMMTNWAGTEKNWRKVADACACPAFLKSEKAMEASCARPSTLKQVSRQGLEELMASPSKHWFVRKFTGDGPNLDKVTLVDGGIVEPLDDVMAGALGAFI